MHLCRSCSETLTPIINFGTMPIANYFREHSDPPPATFEMQALVCLGCSLFQLGDQPLPEDMFNGYYPFYTGLSKHMRQHFSSAFESILELNQDKDKDIFIVEIGCNDGTFLENALKNGVRHLGVDPSSNVVEKCQSKGVNAVKGFFGKEMAEKIIQNHGQANYVFAANVICHIPNVNEIFINIGKLLEHDGVFVFEEPYLFSMLELVSFDQLYDEHVFMFSATSVKNIAKLNNLELFDVEKQQTHGGSMRYFVGKIGQHQISRRLEECLNYEDESGVLNLDIYKKFAENCNKKKTELNNLLDSLKNAGKKVAGYAATSKSTTILNFCEIDSNLISFISDSTPDKIGKITPGSGIPIITHEEMIIRKPDYLVLFAWNHQREILSKEDRLVNLGISWIVFVPEVKILD